MSDCAYVEFTANRVRSIGEPVYFVEKPINVCIPDPNGIMLKDQKHIVAEIDTGRSSARGLLCPEHTTKGRSSV